VRRVALADRMPLSEFGMMMMTDIEGYTPPPGAPEAPFSASSVTPEYFGVLGLPLREGRVFTAADGDQAPLVVVVNEAFGRRYFPGQSVVGRRIASPNRDEAWATVVGVVGDTRRHAQDLDPAPQVYFPFDQWPQPRLAALLELAAASEAVAPAVLRRLREVAPGQAFDLPATVQDRLDRLLAPRRLILSLVGCFAAAAVVLAALGTFGVMSYSVARRRHEFGVRMALGADRARILRHVLAGSARAIAVGLAAGLALTVLSSRLLASMLFGVTRHDPLVLALAAGSLAAVGLAASLLPALHASRTDPLPALRAE